MYKFAISSLIYLGTIILVMGIIDTGYVEARGFSAACPTNLSVVEYLEESITQLDAAKQQIQSTPLVDAKGNIFTDTDSGPGKALCPHAKTAYVLLNCAASKTTYTDENNKLINDLRFSYKLAIDGITEFSDTYAEVVRMGGKITLLDLVAAQINAEDLIEMAGLQAEDFIAYCTKGSTC